MEEVYGCRSYVWLSSYSHRLHNYRGLASEFVFFNSPETGDWTVSDIGRDSIRIHNGTVASLSGPAPPTRRTIITSCPARTSALANLGRRPPNLFKIRSRVWCDVGAMHGSAFHRPRSRNSRIRNGFMFSTTLQSSFHF